MKKIAIIIVVGIALISCLSCKKHKIEMDDISDQEKYFSLVEIINQNALIIYKEIDEDTIRPYYALGESNWNEYEFNHHILPSNPELQPLQILWEDKLLAEWQPANILKLRKNGIIIFPIKTESYFPGTVYYYLIYNPTNKIVNYYPERKKSRIIEKFMIKKNWYYIIEHVYFDWD